MKLRLAACALVLAAACSSKTDDPFTADVKMICGAGQGRDDLPPDLRRMQAFREIADKIRTPEAARLMAAVGQAAPGDKRAIMAPALEKAGVKRCPFLD